MKDVTRRNLLVTTAVGGAAAAFGLRPRPALAFRLEEDEVKERLYLSACEERTAHDQLVRDLIARLEGEQGHAQAVETVRTMTCPDCGCRLAEAVSALAAPS